MILIKVLRFTLAISFACTLSACNLAIQEKLSVLDFNLRKSLKIDGIGLTSDKEKKEAKITNISPIVSQQVSKKEKTVVADSKTNKNKPKVKTKNSLTTTTIKKTIADVMSAPFINVVVRSVSALASSMYTSRLFTAISGR